MHSRMHFLEACIQSRLIYSIQACSLTAQEVNKLEVIWHGFLRRIVRNVLQEKMFQIRATDHQDDGTEICCPKLIADHFNNFLVNVGA